MATFVLTKADTPVNVKETAKYMTAVENGAIKMRIRCVDGQHPVNANDVTQAGKASTIRIRQWSDGACDAIKIKIEK